MRMQWERYSDIINKTNTEDYEDGYRDKEPPKFSMDNEDKSIPVELLRPFEFLNVHKCNTDFYVTQHILTRVKKVAGVEYLREVTPYSFLVGIGRLFGEDAVKDSIKKEVENAQNIAGGLKKIFPENQSSLS